MLNGNLIKLTNRNINGRRCGHTKSKHPQDVREPKTTGLQLPAAQRIDKSGEYLQKGETNCPNLKNYQVEQKRNREQLFLC